MFAPRMVQKVLFAEILSSPCGRLNLLKSLKTMEIYCWKVWRVYPIETAILEIRA
jgi:hypothetical protein